MRRERVRQAWRRVPVPVLALLALLLAGGPVGFALSRDHPGAIQPGNTLTDVSRKAGCQLREYAEGRATNPPITGPLIERAVVADGSHIGQSPPAAATTHALLHGRVLIQYRPGLPKPQVRALDQFVTDDPDRVVGFTNQTGMTAPVAATAYLSMLTCPGVNAGTLHALGAFRDRRRGFANDF